MPNHLLTQVVDTKWAIMPNSLQAIVELVDDHSKEFARSTFHQGEGEMQALIGTVGLPIDGTRFSTQSGSVGILHVDGPIIPRSVNTMSSGPSASLEQFSKELTLMDEDPSINNIVLSFDSPGGVVTGVAEFSNFVRNLSTPVTGFVYGYAASAAYWIASGTDKLYASTTAEVGSIGTVAIFEDRSAADEKKGVQRFEIVSNLSPNKRLDPRSDEGRNETIKILDQITELFIADVATGRGTTTDAVLSSFGQGKMFIASEANDRGMVDGITTLVALVDELNSTTASVTSGAGMLNSQSTPQKAEANMPQSQEPTVLSAEDLKAQQPSAYEQIFQAGVQAEQERLKGIESLVEKDASVASFVNSKKFEAEMTKEKMALAIFEAKDDIKAAHAESIQSSGTQLADALSNVPSAQEELAKTEEATEDNGSDDIVAQMVEGGKAAVEQAKRF